MQSDSSDSSDLSNSTFFWMCVRCPKVFNCPAQRNKHIRNLHKICTCKKNNHYKFIEFEKLPFPCKCVRGIQKKTCSLCGVIKYDLSTLKKHSKFCTGKKEKTC